MNIFFILGCPRSGTTLLQQALNRHSQIVIPPETDFFFLGRTRRSQGKSIQKINMDLGIRIPIPGKLIRDDEDWSRLYLDIADNYVSSVLGRSATFFGDKTPHHLLRIRAIKRLFPDAHYIVIYRDGRDVALSLRNVPWEQPNLYTCFALWLRCYRIQAWLQLHSPRHLLCVKYEDFVASPAVVLSEITRFLGISYEEAMAMSFGNREGILPREYGWKANALKPISKARVGVWRAELSERQKVDLVRLGGTALRALGYEVGENLGNSFPLVLYAQMYGGLAFRKMKIICKIIASEWF